MASSLNSLHAFVAVARSLSFTQAARELGVSTSALSQAVRRLEQEVGSPLLHRSSRHVSLTARGERLLSAAGPALDQALGALDQATAQPGELTGTLRITVPSAATSLVLRRLLPAYVRAHPKVQVDVRVENGFVDIAREGLDAGVRLASAIDRDMVHVRVHGPCRVVVAGAPAYLARRGIPQTPAELADHDCIGLRFTPEGPPFVWELGSGDQEIRVPVRGPLVTNNHAFMRAMALAGVGLLYTLEETIADALASGALQQVLAPYAQPLPGLFLYFPSRAQVSPALRAFIDLARAQIQQPA